MTKCLPVHKVFNETLKGRPENLLIVKFIVVLIIANTGLHGVNASNCLHTTDIGGSEKDSTRRRKLSHH